MAFLKLPFSKESNKEFLLIEIGLGTINMARLLVEPEPKTAEVSRKAFSSIDSMFNASLEAIDSLAGLVENIPKKAILGVSGGPIKTETTVAQYTRPDPKDPITSEEVEKVLEKVSSEQDYPNFKLFFSTIASATIDGTRVSNPIGIKGEKAALSCFIAYKKPEELAVFDKLIDEIDMELTKIIPTSFAVAKIMLQKGTENAILIRVDNLKSEAVFITKSHVSEIFQFDLGASSPEHFLFGVEVALEKFKKEGSPDLIWLYPDSQNVELDSLKEKLESFSWKEAGLEQVPKIQIAEKTSGQADTGLEALTMEAIS